MILFIYNVQTRDRKTSLPSAGWSREWGLTSGRYKVSSWGELRLGDSEPKTAEIVVQL